MGDEGRLNQRGFDQFLEDRSGDFEVFVTGGDVSSELQVFGGPTAASVIAIPNSPPLVGQSFFSQAIAFDAAANAAGIIVSNAVSSLMGSL